MSMIRHKVLLPAAAILAASLTPHAGMAADGARDNRSNESIHQPLVSRTDYVFDVATDGSLSDREQARLISWFDAIGLSYGDRVAISDGSGVDDAAAGKIAEIVGQYGLILAGAAPVTAGSAPSGKTRIVVSRATASVPGCPAWTDQSARDYSSAMSSGYGCAVNGNLAAMIANPDDLVRGAATRSDLRTATSNRAIKVWAEKEPTGAGELKNEKTGAQ